MTGSLTGRELVHRAFDLPFAQPVPTEAPSDDRCPWPSRENRPADRRRQA